MTESPMGLFGGEASVLGTPAKRNELILTRELAFRSRREPTSGWGKVYPTGAHLLIKHGRFYPGRKLPEKYEHLCGELGTCFWTAMAAAELDPELRYVEGIVAAGGGRFTSHAWCIDANGELVDVTWPNEMVGGTDYYTHLPILPHEHWGYWGVVLRPELARTQEEMPMLGRDMAAEAAGGTRQHEDGRWLTTSDLEVTPPAKLPLLDVPYDPDRTEFA